jgi:hypothetical protein
MNPDHPQQPAHQQQAQATLEAEQDQQHQPVPAVTTAAETDNNRDDESLIEADEVSSPRPRNIFISAPPRYLRLRPVPPLCPAPFHPAFCLPALFSSLADPLRLQEHRIFADADSTLGDDV